MIHTDTVTCEDCGAEIEHVLCGQDVVALAQSDPDYYRCADCIAQHDYEIGADERWIPA